MMNDQNQLDQERIEAYIRGNLSPDEMKSFELEMARDEILVNEVNLARKLEESLGDQKLNAFRGLVQDVIESERPKTNQGSQKSAKDEHVKIRSIGWGKWAIAASVVALLGLAIWNFVGKNGSGTTELYAEYYQPYPSYAVNRSEDHSPQLQEAMENYNAGNYDRAYEMLSILFLEQDQDESIQLYAAVSALELENWREAQKMFGLIKSGSVFYDQAQWYLSLIYLKNNRVLNAQKILNELAQKPGKLGKQAQELLAELE